MAASLSDPLFLYIRFKLKAISCLKSNSSYNNICTLNHNKIIQLSVIFIEITFIINRVQILVVSKYIYIYIYIYIYMFLIITIVGKLKLEQ